MSPAKSMPAAALGRSIGMTLFPTDLAPYAPSERARLLADFAEAGLEHVHCGDHVSFHDGYGWDGFVNAATFLALHDTLHVHLGLYLLPLRHPLAEEGGTSRPTWRHSIVVWCGLDRDREVARRAVAAEMKALYKIDYDDFARWCPAGSAEEVAEFVAPYLDAGARDVSLIARGRTLRDTIAQAAEVRRMLLRTNSAARRPRSRLEENLMSKKVLYEKRGEVAYVTLNRPECKNAVDYETHLLLCDAWKDFRDDPKLRVAILTGTGDAFTAGADLKTHAPEWQKVGPMVGRERLEDGLSGITRGPLSRIAKPIVAAINGWCLGHGVELAMACDIRVASERAQFGTFEVRRGMHAADGGIVRLVNVCGAGIALEMVLTGEPINAERALMANMVSRVVRHDELMPATEELVSCILRNDQAAIQSAKETVLEVIGRPLHDQLRVEAMWGYALCGGNQSVMERSQQFFEKTDRGRAGATKNSL